MPRPINGDSADRRGSIAIGRGSVLSTGVSSQAGSPAVGLDDGWKPLLASSYKVFAALDGAWRRRGKSGFDGVENGPVVGMRPAHSALPPFGVANGAPKRIPREGVDVGSNGESCG